MGTTTYFSMVKLTKALTTIVILSAMLSSFSIAKAQVSESFVLNDRVKEIAKKYQKQFGCIKLEESFSKFFIGDTANPKFVSQLNQQTLKNIKACHQFEHGFSSFVLGLTRIVGEPEGYISYDEAITYFTHAAHEGFTQGAFLGLSMMATSDNPEIRNDLEKNIHGVAKLINALELEDIQKVELLDIISKNISLKSRRDELQKEYNRMSK